MNLIEEVQNVLNSPMSVIIMVLLCRVLAEWNALEHIPLFLFLGKQGRQLLEYFP